MANEGWLWRAYVGTLGRGGESDQEEASYPEACSSFLGHTNMVLRRSCPLLRTLESTVQQDHSTTFEVPNHRGGSLFSMICDVLSVLEIALAPF